MRGAIWHRRFIVMAAGDCAIWNGKRLNDVSASLIN
jgi:hypothetical protein